MWGPESADTPPPEVPEEFADAYREAYRRALAAEADVDASFASALPDVSAEQLARTGTHRSPDDAAPAGADWRSSRWFLPGVIVASGVVLVLAAYAAGTALSGGNDPGVARPSAAHTAHPGHAHPHSSRAKPPKAAPSTAPGGWRGAVEPVTVDAISADCTAPPGRDSAGNAVTYVPENAVDPKADTAWRCVGTAVGQKLVLRLSSEADVAEVGLVPGYAKTDPESGVDRYAENNRITRVRWTLGDGTSVVQRLDPDPSSRAVQLLRVPRTRTDTVTLEILAVKRGPRNTTAISEIALAAAASA